MTKSTAHNIPQLLQPLQKCTFIRFNIGAPAYGTKNVLIWDKKYQHGMGMTCILRNQKNMK